MDEAAKEQAEILKAGFRKVEQLVLKLCPDGITRQSALFRLAIALDLAQESLIEVDSNSRGA